METSNNAVANQSGQGDGGLNLAHNPAAAPAAVSEAIHDDALEAHLRRLDQELAGLGSSDQLANGNRPKNTDGQWIERRTSPRPAVVSIRHLAEAPADESPRGSALLELARQVLRGKER